MTPSSPTVTAKLPSSSSLTTVQGRGGPGLPKCLPWCSLVGALVHAVDPLLQTHPPARLAIAHYLTHLDDRPAGGSKRGAGHGADRARDPYGGGPRDGAYDEPAQGGVYDGAQA